MRTLLPMVAAAATFSLATGQTTSHGLESPDLSATLSQIGADNGPVNRFLGGAPAINLSAVPTIQAASSNANIVGVNVRLAEGFTSTPVDFVAN